MAQTFAEVYAEQRRAAREWREANKEDIARRVAEFRRAYDKIVEDFRLCIAGDYCDLYLVDIDQKPSSAWVARLEP